jgi:hypothetical protein
VRPLEPIVAVDAIVDVTTDATSVETAGTDASVHWVRVTCPTCGIVRVPPDGVVIRNCVDDQSWTYRARCSQCHKLFLGITPESLARVGLASGVAVETWTLPLPSARRPGSPLRALDALELHLALLEPDWFDDFARVLPPLGDH